MSSSPIPTDDLVTLRAELQVVRDRAELTDLVGRLARWLDGRATGDPTTLFAPDMRAVTPGGEVHGRDAVIAQAQKNHNMPTHHLVGSVAIDLAGDTARITAAMTGHFLRSEDTVPGPTELGGHYELHATRADDRWLLTSLEAAPVWRVEAE
jgi:SnoaL-like domain